VKTTIATAALAVLLASTSLSRADDPEDHKLSPADKCVIIYSKAYADANVKPIDLSVLTKYCEENAALADYYVPKAPYGPETFWQAQWRTGALPFEKESDLWPRHAK
jgi:hypothetical protein